MRYSAASTLWACRCLQYEVLNGLFHGEYLRGLTSYVENDRYAKRVLGGNIRGKNQLRVLKWLIVMSAGGRPTEALNEYVSKRQTGRSRMISERSAAT